MPRGETMEKQIQALMNLGLSREEALQTLADDKDIDQGKPKDFDLSAEQMKNAKQYTKVGTRKTSTTPTKRERKENPTKALIIAELFKFLGENSEISAENLEILNKERQIFFKCGENDYELTLTQKRKPKN
jgi:hypothetical protein